MESGVCRDDEQLSSSSSSIMAMMSVHQAFFSNGQDESAALHRNLPAPKQNTASAKHESVGVSIDLRPPLTSAAGLVIYPDSLDESAFFELLENSADLSGYYLGNKKEKHAELLQSFSKALLLPRIPQLVEKLYEKADSSAQFCLGFGNRDPWKSSTERHWSEYVYDHHSNMQQLILLCSTLREKARSCLGEMLSEEAAQNLGFARMLRLCKIRHESQLEHRAQKTPVCMTALFDVGGLWKCADCSFPNEDMRASACTVCGGQRTNGSCVLQMHDVPLAPQEAIKQIRKQTKKLKKVSILCIWTIDNSLFFELTQTLRRLKNSPGHPLFLCWRKISSKKSVCPTICNCSNRSFLSEIFIPMLPLHAPTCIPRAPQNGTRAKLLTA
jgi:hypothetical protein